MYEECLVYVLQALEIYPENTALQAFALQVHSKKDQWNALVIDLKTMWHLHLWNFNPIICVLNHIEYACKHGLVCTASAVSVNAVLCLHVLLLLFRIPSGNYHAYDMYQRIPNYILLIKCLLILHFCFLLLSHLSYSIQDIIAFCLSISSHFQLLMNHWKISTYFKKFL